MRTQQKPTALETTRTRSASRGQSHCRVNCTNPSTLSRKAYLERALRGRAQAAGKVLGTARGDEHGELLHLFALGQHHCLIAADQCTRNARRRRIYENGEAKLFKFASAPTYMRFAMLIATVLGGTAPAAPLPGPGMLLATRLLFTPWWICWRRPVRASRGKAIPRALFALLTRVASAP